MAIVYTNISQSQMPMIFAPNCILFINWNEWIALCRLLTDSERLLQMHTFIFCVFILVLQALNIHPLNFRLNFSISQYSYHMAFRCSSPLDSCTSTHNIFSLISIHFTALCFKAFDVFCFGLQLDWDCYTLSYLNSVEAFDRLRCFHFHCSSCKSTYNHLKRQRHGSFFLFSSTTSIDCHRHSSHSAAEAYSSHAKYTFATRKYHSKCVCVCVFICIRSAAEHTKESSGTNTQPHRLFVFVDFVWWKLE